MGRREEGGIRARKKGRDRIGWRERGSRAGGGISKEGRPCVFCAHFFSLFPAIELIFLLFLFYCFQIGSFNYDNTKMHYHTYYLPKLPNSTDSILDFEV